LHCIYYFKNQRNQIIVISAREMPQKFLLFTPIATNKLYVIKIIFLIIYFCFLYIVYNTYNLGREFILEINRKCLLKICFTDDIIDSEC